MTYMHLIKKRKNSEVTQSKGEVWNNNLVAFL